MTPYYDYDVSYIVDMIELAGRPYKVIGMSDCGNANGQYAWTVRFDTVNYIEVYADYYVIQLGTVRQEYREMEDFNRAFKEIMEYAKKGLQPEFA
jgi:hypothetical protein